MQRTHEENYLVWKETDKRGNFSDEIDTSSRKKMLTGLFLKSANKKSTKYYIKN